MSVDVGSVATVGAPCGDRGGSAYDKFSHKVHLRIFPTFDHCWMMYGPPVIMTGSYMSVKEGFSHINYVFHTFGDQPALPTPLGLKGTIA